MKFTALAAQIASASGVVIDTGSANHISGGTVNDTVRFDSSAGPIFVKLSHRSRIDMFDAERDGLETLTKTKAIRVPAVICSGVVETRAFLALEYLDLKVGNNKAQRILGEAIAALHKITGEEFGWHRDNNIGSTLQINTRHTSWVSFFTECRLNYQIELALENGGASLYQAFEPLRSALPVFFSAATFVPSLLHGDLWAGNWGVFQGQPVIFDPAVHYGDSEADIAMTELFGGFGEAFYQSYRKLIPEQPGSEQRRELYKLYHVINHFNLFGGGYQRQASAMIKNLLRQADRA